MQHLAAQRPELLTLGATQRESRAPSCLGPNLLFERAVIPMLERAGAPWHGKSGPPPNGATPLRPRTLRRLLGGPYPRWSALQARFSSSRLQRAPRPSTGTRQAAHRPAGAAFAFRRHARPFQPRPACLSSRKPVFPCPVHVFGGTLPINGLPRQDPGMITPASLLATPPRPPRLLDRLRSACRVRQLSPRTEDCYATWAELSATARAVYLFPARASAPAPPSRMDRRRHRQDRTRQPKAPARC
jgi:hypothetical protein